MFNSLFVLAVSVSPREAAFVKKKKKKHIQIFFLLCSLRKASIFLQLNPIPNLQNPWKFPDSQNPKFPRSPKWINFIAKSKEEDSAATLMAAPRITAVAKEEEEEEDDSPFSKRPSSSSTKLERFPLSRWEFAAAVSVFFVFSAGLFCIYWTMPAAEYRNLRIPRSVSELRLLKDHLGTYANDHPAQFILGYSSTYIFMQTFMIPGTIFMSLLAGALFGVIRGLFLVVFNATAGASSCFFLSKLIGRPVVSWLWPDKLRFFQGEIAKRRDKLLNYMLFLRITPTLPNLFINLASPIVDIPFHVFFLATLIGIVPASYITVRAGLALGDLKSVKDLYDFRTLSVLFIIGSISIFPTLLKRKRIYE